MSNFIAGFEGAAYDARYRTNLALPLIKGAGVIYHATGVTKAKDDPFDNIGISEIDEGALYGYAFAGSAKCGCNQ